MMDDESVHDEAARRLCSVHGCRGPCAAAAERPGAPRVQPVAALLEAGAPLRAGAQRAASGQSQSPAGSSAQRRGGAPVEGPCARSQGGQAKSPVRSEP